jgi:hypothetical protein
MRSIALLIAGTFLASCMATAGPPEYAQRSPSGQRAYETLFAGKVAGRPINCLPNYNANDMSIIDGHTIGFRVTSRTSYLVHLGPGCELLGTGNYALLSRQFGGGGLCRGDIQQVVDTLNHTNMGSCTITAIEPYTRP